MKYIAIITLLMFFIGSVNAGHIYVKSPDGHNHGGLDMKDWWTLKVTETVAGQTIPILDYTMKEGYYFPNYVELGDGFGNSASKINVYYHLHQTGAVMFGHYGKDFDYSYTLNQTDYGDIENPKDIYMNLRSSYTFCFFYMRCDGGGIDFTYKPSSDTQYSMRNMILPTKGRVEKNIEQNTNKNE